MELSPTTPAQVQTGTPATTAAQSDDTSVLASDFETFLRLLTTQLENQDPSKPMDSTEFVAQLASFSAVEQQINTNNKLDQLITQFSGGLSQDLTSWLGSSVLAPAAARFEGTPLEIRADIPSAATSATLRVTDASGSIIDTRSIDPGKSSFSWDGQDTSGQRSAAGEYRFEIEAFEGSISLGLQTAKSFSNVTEARLVDGAIELIFADGTRMAAADVEAVSALP